MDDQKESRTRIMLCPYTKKSDGKVNGKIIVTYTYRMMHSPAIGNITYIPDRDTYLYDPVLYEHKDGGVSVITGDDAYKELILKRFKLKPVKIYDDVDTFNILGYTRKTTYE
jgi:hypothetical protein